MKPPFPTLLVSHRGFGEGLLAAAEAILGASPAVDHMSNDGLSPEALGQAIDRWLAGHPGPAVILTDLGFGSCCQAARRVARDRDDVAVVAGINLPVLLAAVRSREHTGLAAFLRHLDERGRGGFEMYLSGRRI